MRAIWKGALSFGLINIPINLYSATREHELKFKMLHNKDLSEIRYSRICKEEGKEVPYKEIVKGYEQSPGHFVVLTDEDFEKAQLEKTKTIDIISFTDENEIDSIYYEKPYVLEPDKRAAKAYVLLRDALKKSGRVAVVKYVFKNHERLGVIKPHDKMLVLNQLRYQDEIVIPKDLAIPDVKVVAKELGMALELVKQLSEPFHPEKFKDTYVEDLHKIIEQKSRGAVVPKKGKPAPSPKVHDIVSLLKESLKQGEKHEDSKRKSNTKARNQTEIKRKQRAASG